MKQEIVKKRMPKDRLNIGTYILKPCDEAHVRDLAACGIDFLVCAPADKESLDTLYRNGVYAFVSGVLPGWWGGEGDNAGQLSAKNPLSVYEEKAKQFADHPAVWGLDIGDEPSALDFPYYGKVFDLVTRLKPDQVPYLNLYPNYASVAVNTGEQTVNQLGTPTYAEHIAAYCKNVPADYISFDFYVYACDVSHFYDNLNCVAKACAATGRDMWFIPQVNSLDPNVFLSENMLRYQAFLGLAFGAKNLTWACWSLGWWSNNVLTTEGEKTEQYEKLKQVNKELHGMGEAYGKYRYLSTSVLAFKDDSVLKASGMENLQVYGDGFFCNLKSDTPLAVGAFTDNGSKRALLLATVGDPYDNAPENGTVTFTTPCAEAEITVLGKDGPEKLSRAADGTYTLQVTTNRGYLVEMTL